MPVTIGLLKRKEKKFVPHEEPVDASVFDDLPKLKSLEDAVIPIAVADARLRPGGKGEVQHAPIYVFGVSNNGGSEGYLIYRPRDPLESGVLAMPIKFKHVYLFHIIGPYTESLVGKVTKLLTPPDPGA